MRSDSFANNGAALARINTYSAANGCGLQDKVKCRAGNRRARVQLAPSQDEWNLGGQNVAHDATRHTRHRTHDDRNQVGQPRLLRDLRPADPSASPTARQLRGGTRTRAYRSVSVAAATATTMFVVSVIQKTG